MKKLLYVLPIVALLAAGCNSSTTAPTPASTEQSASVDTNSTAQVTPPATAPATPAAPANATPAPAAAAKNFTVVGSNFAFAPNKLTVNRGDKVKITFQNSGGSHDFVLDGYNAKTAIIGSGQTATVEFTADKAGTFPFYCSVANHRAMGMAGTLTVQ